MTDFTQWLFSLCNRDGSPLLRQPFRAVFRGKSWAVATNGHAMVALRGVRVPKVDVDISGPLNLLKKTDCVWVEMNLSRLAEFARRGTDVTESCPKCKGTGHAPCELRGQPYINEQCEVCDGAKRIRPRSFATFAPGVVVDRNLLNLYLGDLKANIIHVASDGPLDPIRIDAVDWLLVIMPVKFDKDDTLEATL